MHIAIEGMDGVGKTSQAKELAKRINGEFVPKSLHEMIDAGMAYDNFISIQEYTNNEIVGCYGLRQDFFRRKILGLDIVTDRFYVSNYWRRAKRLSVKYFKRISQKWGKPDLVIILYARPSILRDRILKRNKDDKDLAKIKEAEKAYALMLKFAREMNFNTLIIDTSEMSFQEVSNMILYAKNEGIEKCEERYQRHCKVFWSNVKYISVDKGVLIVAEDGELIKCKGSMQELVIPHEVTSIGEKAFVMSPALRRLYLSQETNLISDFAFDGSNICEIYTLEENPKFYANGRFLLNKKGDILLQYLGKDIDEVKVPEGIVHIGNKAFANCLVIKKVILPSSLREIHQAAFAGCSNLKYIKFSSGEIKTIRAGVFMNCQNLSIIELTQSIHIKIEDDCIKTNDGNIIYFFGKCKPRNILYNVPKCEYIYPYAYNARLNAKKVVIHNETIKIGSHAFEQCEIEQVILGISLNDIGEKSFADCGIKSIQIVSSHIPGKWSNSIDSYTDILVPNDKLFEYYKNTDWNASKVSAIIASKTETELCGTACMRYIFNQKLSLPFQEENELFWIMELGSVYLKCYQKSVCVYYYDSKLMKNYYRKTIYSGKLEVQAINKFIELGGILVEKRFFLENLLDCATKCKWIILLLDSECLFGDKTMRGNSHYVILEKFDIDQSVIILPGRRYIYRRIIDNKILMCALKRAGQWVLTMM